MAATRLEALGSLAEACVEIVQAVKRHAQAVAEIAEQQAAAGRQRHGSGRPDDWTTPPPLPFAPPPPPLPGDVGLAVSRLARAARLTLVLQARLGSSSWLRTAGAGSSVPERARRMRAARRRWDQEREQSQAQNQTQTGAAHAPSPNNPTPPETTAPDLPPPDKAGEVAEIMRNVIRAEHVGPETFERLMNDVWERLEDEEALGDLMERSTTEIAEQLYRDLGLTSSWSQWALEVWTGTYWSRPEPDEDDEPGLKGDIGPYPAPTTPTATTMNAPAGTGPDDMVPIIAFTPQNAPPPFTCLAIGGQARRSPDRVGSGAAPTASPRLPDTS